MKSVEIKKDIIILEEKLKIILESGEMTVNDFADKTGSSRPWIYDWKNGRKKASYNKIIDMAGKLTL